MGYDLRTWAAKYPGDPEALIDALLQECERLAAPPPHSQASEVVEALRQALIKARRQIEDQAAMPTDTNWIGEVLALSRQAPDMPSGEWQTIESAPKDGKDILLAGDGRLVRVAFWDEARGGLWSIWPGREPYILPTHWMPLPAAPTAQAKADIADHGDTK